MRKTRKMDMVLYHKDLFAFEESIINNNLNDVKATWAWMETAWLSLTKKSRGHGLELLTASGWSCLKNGFYPHFPQLTQL